MLIRALPNPFRGLVSLFYPAFCAVCSGAVEPREDLCAVCAGQATRIVPPFCAKCSQPFDGAITGTFTCANCQDRVLHFEAAVSAYRSRGVVRKVMLDFKYGRQIHLRHLLGRWLSETLADPRLAGRHFDLIVPVPLHPAKKRERGFNQAELLAAVLRRRSGVRVENVLQRTRYTLTQTQFDRSERMENLRGAFRLRRGSNVQDLRMLLVDDVLTTGSTLSECASVLKKAGAHSVHAATAARG
ncbi:MAG TPA: ComF family protein [Chthoniobacterales bacterium]|nr:ComF family protein [Chthoniobacterales bacterium]